ncbi:hypothetical protein Aasi_1265 [Candidatus Amoebophilus asiaticus 5a2]|uniref:Outer membrane protein beta-barrel domain-containing protein n=1 Tax=Amoebophilus asiaticus (strain 5a2) TaxID=452471 RepID=B3ETN5_AMOA5|nr:hypothetical protein [Candidatus Amoebophilus asiaticus]ACE06587.1 hypothetical protein Aasi_1265 [Candidatus Amoebophilus asiaticus 5a2]
MQGGLGILSFITLGTAIFSSRGGVFGEYKIAKSVGIQTGLVCYYNWYHLGYTDKTQTPHLYVRPIYFMAPIILRYYLGQNCLLVGLQIGYLVAGSAVPHRCCSNHEEKAPPIPLTSQKLPVNKLGLSLIIGYDYEFNYGLIIGLSYIEEFIPVINSRTMGWEWCLQPTIGYNFAKLLK